MALIRHADATRIARDAIVLNLGDVQRQAAQLMEQARRRAEQIVEEARAERERIVAGAAEKGRADGIARGTEEGKRAGIEQGKAAAVAEWRTKLAEVEKRWTEALARLEAERDGTRAEARADLLGLALKIGEKVVKRKIEVDHGVVADQLQAVLSLVARPTELLVRINPEDKPVTEAALPGLMARFQSVRHVELVDDPTVTRGSCVARTRGQGDGGSAGGGEIEASIEEQLNRIAELLLPGRSADPATDRGSRP
jgi:flagellar biosynthesis/type III secretory pathway protein FliH